MRERAELLGGALTIESAPGHGTSIFIEIPLPDPQSPITNHQLPVANPITR
jgi:nitrate/nitrite-specific signal transduction histidine kinase